MALCRVVVTTLALLVVLIYAPPAVNAKVDSEMDKILLETGALRSNAEEDPKSDFSHTFTQRPTYLDEETLNLLPKQIRKTIVDGGKDQFTVHEEDEDEPHDHELTQHEVTPYFPRFAEAKVQSRRGHITPIPPMQESDHSRDPSDSRRQRHHGRDDGSGRRMRMRRRVSRNRREGRRRGRTEHARNRNRRRRSARGRPDIRERDNEEDREPREPEPREREHKERAHKESREREPREHERHEDERFNQLMQNIRRREQPAANQGNMQAAPAQQQQMGPPGMAPMGMPQPPLPTGVGFGAAGQQGAPQTTAFSPWATNPRETGPDQHPPSNPSKMQPSFIQQYPSGPRGDMPRMDMGSPSPSSQPRFAVEDQQRLNRWRQRGYSGLPQSIQETRMERMRRRKQLRAATGQGRPSQPRFAQQRMGEQTGQRMGQQMGQGMNQQVPVAPQPPVAPMAASSASPPPQQPFFGNSQANVPSGGNAAGLAPPSAPRLPPPPNPMTDYGVGLLEMGAKTKVHGQAALKTNAVLSNVLSQATRKLRGHAERARQARPPTYDTSPDQFASNPQFLEVASKDAQRVSAAAPSPPMVPHHQMTMQHIAHSRGADVPPPPHMAAGPMLPQPIHQKMPPKEHDDLADVFG